MRSGKKNLKKNLTTFLIFLSPVVAFILFYLSVSEKISTNWVETKGDFGSMSGSGFMLSNLVIAILLCMPAMIVTSRFLNIYSSSLAVMGFGMFLIYRMVRSWIIFSCMYYKGDTNNLTFTVSILCTFTLISIFFLVCPIISGLLISRSIVKESLGKIS